MFVDSRFSLDECSSRDRENATTRKPRRGLGPAAFFYVREQYEELGAALLPPLGRVPNFAEGLTNEYVVVAPVSGD
jgi:hypothetical protein